MDISDWYFNINSTDQMKEFLYEFLNLEPVKKTKSDKNISVDEEVINTHAERDGIEFCKLLVNYRKLLKAKNTYLKDIFRNISFDTGCIHPSLWLNTTTTMRGCLAKGTMIDTVRDVSKYPNGIPIEQVKKGDYVYCYDDNLKPQIKKVLWSGITGFKKVIRLHWKSSYKRKGYIDLTPEHQVRTTNGNYIEAQDSLKKDVLALTSTSDRFCLVNFITKLNRGIITKIEWLNKIVPVYDLTVEDCHNFIANGICVHNSGTDPNITNQPKHGEIVPGLDWKIIRKLFSLKPEEMNDYFFAEVDYEQSEMKVTGMLSSDPQLIEDLNSDFDFHSHWAIELFGLKGLSYSEVKSKYDDTYRFLAKNNFTFADIFGAVNTSIAREMRKSPFYIEYVQGIYNQIPNRKEKFDKFFVDYSEQQVLNCQNARKERYPIYTAWQESIVTNYYQTGYVEDPFGFRRNYPLTRNEIINKPIQSTSFLLLLDSLINIEDEVEKDIDYWKCYLIGQVHDSGVSKVNKYQAGDWIDMVDEKMTYKPHLPWSLSVQMQTDWSFSKNWYNMFKVKKYKKVK